MKHDSYYARLKSILAKPKNGATILVSRRVLEGLADEMEEVARRLARAEAALLARIDKAPSISGPEPTYEQAMRRRDELLVTLPGMNGVVDIGAGMDPEKE